MKSILKGNKMRKKIYLIIIHVFALIGISTTYLTISASLGFNQHRTVGVSPDGCLTGESDKIASPNGKSAIHAQYHQCPDSDNIMKVWLQPDTDVTRYTRIYESIYNSDVVIDLKWEPSGDVIITIPNTVSPTSVLSNHMGVGVHVVTRQL